MERGLWTIAGESGELTGESAPRYGSFAMYLFCFFGQGVFRLVSER